MASEDPATDPPVAGTDGRAGAIRVRGLTKEFETAEGTELVFEDVDFDVEPGSFVTLIGKSGSGKSTLLNIISGVLDPTAGRVRFDAGSGSRGGPDDGSAVRVGHVFQEPRLLPWNTCVENIEYVHEDNPDYTDALARQYLDVVGLSDHYDKYPAQLSGGQKQRVGIARAFSVDPDVLLMDEPFSALDEITAESLRSELLDLWQRFGKTIFFVTHDITEAIELSDEILMIGDGGIYDRMTVDLGRPREADAESFLAVRGEAIDRFHAVD
jgi:NitT/TauT family transport system ATP-binding protein